MGEGEVGEMGLWPEPCPASSFLSPFSSLLLLSWGICWYPESPSAGSKGEAKPPSLDRGLPRGRTRASPATPGGPAGVPLGPVPLPGQKLSLPLKLGASPEPVPLPPHQELSQGYPSDQWLCLGRS